MPHSALNTSVNDTAGATPISVLLPRLKQVREIKDGQGKACCPAHDDRRPSLAWRQTTDGTILLKCWAGCTALEIVHAVGLELKDLFPRRKSQDGKPLPQRVRWDYQALLITLSEETTLICVSAHDLANNRPINEPDRQRLIQAARRVNEIAEAAR